MLPRSLWSRHDSSLYIRLWLFGLFNALIRHVAELKPCIDLNIVTRQKVETSEKSIFIYFILCNFIEPQMGEIVLIRFMLVQQRRGPYLAAAAKSVVNQLNLI